MTPELDKSLASAVEALKNGVLDLSAQFPELAQQIIARQQVGAWIGIALATAAFLVAVVFLVAGFRGHDDEGGFWGCSMVAALVGTIIAAFNIHTLLVCAYVPKTVVLEEISRFIR